MNQYKIIYYNDNFCLVALNTVYNIGKIMKEFVKAEIQNSNYNGMIIFDSLLSSTSHDDCSRFYCFKSINGKVDFNNKIVNYKLSDSFISKFDKYFDNNKKLVNSSFLLDLF